VKQHEVTGFGLRFAQSEPQAYPLYGVGVLAAFQGVTGAAVA
jgi:hypothetical protein